jgi:cholinesterase
LNVQGFSCPINNIFGSAGELNATNSSLTPAGRLILSTWQQPHDIFDEDCLTLNIWTKPQVGDEKKAVLLWIYGGAFQSGASADSFYDGQYIADQENVIVVSMK